MNKKLKLSLLGTLIASSALSITMPIVSCSSSVADVILTVTDATDIVDKKSTVEIELDKLITATTDVERQKEFEALSTKVYNANSIGDDKTTWDALVGIVIFKDGEAVVDWTDVVGSVSIVPGTWPTGLTSKEAPVKMKINLKPGYIAVDAATLSIDMNISVGSAILTVTNTSDFDTKKTAVEAELDKLITATTDAERQKEFKALNGKVYNANSIGTDKTTWDALVGIVTLKDGEVVVDWTDAVESVSIVPGEWPTGLTSKEAPVKMKINLKPGYNVADAATLSINMNISVGADTNTITLTWMYVDTQKPRVEKYLDKLITATTDETRKTQFEALSTKVLGETEPNDTDDKWILTYLNAMMSLKNGETPKYWTDVVKSITFVPGAWPTGNGNTAKEAPIKIKVNLKPGYIVIDDTTLYIDMSITIPAITSGIN